MLIPCSANYFLLRNGEFCVALIREIERLKLSRLTPRASSRTPGVSIIREQDLSLALLRASLGTSAQHDPSLSRLRFTLPSGPLRPFLNSFSGHPDLSMFSIRSASTPVDFSTTLLGTRLELTYQLAWPLDLFLTPHDLRAYASLFSYFSSVRHTHTRVMTCWSSLSNAQRVRRRWVHFDDGGEARRDLLRCGWGVVREMVWFLDALWAYLMTDVVDAGYKRLKARLQPPSGSSSGLKRSGSMKSELGGSAYGGAPSELGSAATPFGRGRRESAASSVYPPPKTTMSGFGGTDATAASPAHGPLDFSTLRQLHSSYLHALLAGSLLSNVACMATIKGIMEVCEVLVGSIERWGGDVLPDLLGEGSIAKGVEGEGAIVQDRRAVVRDVNEVSTISLSRCG